jgi:hypothetical protein
MATVENGALKNEFDGVMKNEHDDASHLVGDVSMDAPPHEEPANDLDAPAAEAKVEDAKDEPMEDLFGETEVLADDEQAPADDTEAAADAEEAGDAAAAER